MNQGFEQLITYLLQRFLTNTSYKGTSLALLKVAINNLQ